jgi:hypothetical protein
MPRGRSSSGSSGGMRLPEHVAQQGSWLSFGGRLDGHGAIGIAALY